MAHRTFPITDTTTVQLDTADDRSELPRRQARAFLAREALGALELLAWRYRKADWHVEELLE